MALGQIGFLTDAAEALATAVGAGMLLGSFGGGALGLLSGQSRDRLEARILNDGYHGGLLGVVLVAVDLIFRYSD